LVPTFRNSETTRASHNAKSLAAIILFSTNFMAGAVQLCRGTVSASLTV